MDYALMDHEGTHAVDSLNFDSFLGDVQVRVYVIHRVLCRGGGDARGILAKHFVDHHVGSWLRDAGSPGARYESRVGPRARRRKEVIGCVSRGVGPETPVDPLGMEWAVDHNLG